MTPDRLLRLIVGVGAERRRRGTVLVFSGLIGLALDAIVYRIYSVILAGGKSTVLTEEKIVALTAKPAAIFGIVTIFGMALLVSGKD